jgi:hypothetical protein
MAKVFFRLDLGAILYNISFALYLEDVPLTVIHILLTFITALDVVSIKEPGPVESYRG